MVTEANSDLQSLPGTAHKFLVYLLAFTVTLGVGIGPLLGVIRVPGFITMGELFPLNLQRAVAAFAAFLLTLTAVGVQFFGGDRFDSDRLKAAFKIVFVAVFVGIVALYLAYTSWVASVEVGGSLSAAYVVGPTMLPDCVCVAHKLQITSCIGPVLDTNPAHVEDCYPRQDIVTRRTDCRFSTSSRCFLSAF